MIYHALLKREPITRPPHSIASPLALIGPAHFAISLTTNFCRYSGDLRSSSTTMAPMSLRRCCTDGVSIAATAAACSFATIAAGVPLCSPAPSP